LKIISGSKKSHLVNAPKNLPVRPTSGLVKESLFNILNNYFNFNDITVLDLYAGTGNISYEFGSRGCQKIDSIDINSRCTSFIKKKSLELNFKINVIKSSADKFIKKNQSKYDIIFADPPYEYMIAEYTDLVNSIFDQNMLYNQGLLVIEHEKKIELNKHNMFYFEKKYGGTILSFFKKQAYKPDSV